MGGRRFRIAGLVRPLVGGAGLLAAVASVALAAAPALAAEACRNAQLRTEDNSTALPDCRAYEMVSPAEKDGFNVAFGAHGAGSTPFFAAPVAPSGDLVSYYSFGSFAGNPSSAYINQYLSTRTGSGWSTQGISPVKEAPFYGIDVHTSYTGFSSDLSNMAVVNWVAPGLYALLLRNESGAFKVVAEGGPTEVPIFAGASEDFSRVLIVQTKGGDHLYEWSEGKLHPISGVEGTSSLGEAGASTGPFGSSWGRAISADGARVFWSGSGEGPYLYENETQANIAASQCTTGRVGEAGAGGNCAAPGTGTGTFQTSSREGEVAFITSDKELTNTANTGETDGGSDLYSYEAASGKLKDLTPDAGAANGAEVLGVVGVSEDASYVYFVAEGVLAAGATQGADNLYLWHNGTTKFVAALSGADFRDWAANESALEHSRLTQTSADGQELLFTSVGSPTGYASGGQSEIYAYQASSGKLRCVSCNPAGTEATAGASLGSVANGPQDGATTYDNISLDGGRVFFQSAESLLPQDSNGLEDVYEWEADGVGSCESEAQDGGCLYSISTGRSGSSDYFQNATPSGQDVFFVTGQQLVGQDDDTLVDMYDARVDGGFPAPSQPSPCAEALGCRGASPAGATLGAPGSELVTGVGNLAVEGKANSTPVKQKNKKKKLTRQKRLKRALSQCRKRPPKRRAKCRAGARRRYGQRGAEVRDRRPAVRKPRKSAAQDRPHGARHASTKRMGGR